MKNKFQTVKVILPQPIDFEWDNWNKEKNQIKHNVSTEEAEQVFADENKKIFYDKAHSIKEKRFIIIGSCKNRRVLYVAFSLRSKRVRVISAKDLNRKERFLYS